MALRGPEFCKEFIAVYLFFMRIKNYILAEVAVLKTFSLGCVVFTKALL